MLRKAKYTLFIFRCLRTGNHFVGMTTDLQGAARTLLGKRGHARLFNPELLHIEQHENAHLAHRRMQEILGRWPSRSSHPSNAIATPPVSALTAPVSCSRH